MMFAEISLLKAMGEDITLSVSMGPSKQNIFIPKSEMKDLNERSFGIFPTQMEPMIQQVAETGPAKDVGLQKGDIITEANGNPIMHSQQFVDIIKSNAGKDIAVKWNRGGTQMSGNIKTCCG
jgi:S1-C subfamily serine protease